MRRKGDVCCGDQARALIGTQCQCGVCEGSSCLHLDDRQQVRLCCDNVNFTRLRPQSSRKYCPAMTDEREARCRFGIDATDIGGGASTRLRRHAEKSAAIRLTWRKHDVWFQGSLPDPVSSDRIYQPSSKVLDPFRGAELPTGTVPLIAGGAADVPDYSAASRRTTASA